MNRQPPLRMVASAVVMLLASVANAGTTITTTVLAKTDALGRVQVAIDTPGPSFDVYLFHPEGTLPTIAPQTFRAMVTIEPRRLLVDALEGTLHLDLFLGSLGHPAVVEGEGPVLRASGVALARFPVLKRRRPLERIDLGDISIVWNSDLASRYPSYEALGAEDIDCRDHKVIRDRSCTKGGPGALTGPSFTCASTKVTSALASSEITSQSVGEIECAEGFYPCGTCVGAQALQVCKSYTC